MLNFLSDFSIGIYLLLSAPVIFDFQFPLIDNPGNFCWFGQILIILKVAIDRQIYLANKVNGQDFPSPFHEALDGNLELAAIHVLDPRHIFNDFLEYFVAKDHGIVFEDSMEVRLEEKGCQRKVGG